ncbi:MAG: DNA repair protein RecN [Gammaproteobacteria bacterium]|nr:DNA repair protein RecN [Gammaproteobacteria bacterium]
MIAVLTHLHIRHFAIIDQTEFELEPGMTALTGETGAGKSILLDALGQVLGDRATVDFVQKGASRSEVSATFHLAALPHVQQWLREHELDNDDNDECLIRRIVTDKGKSRAIINDQPVTAKSLRALGQRLVSIHGQHAHQSLTEPAEQRRLVDALANSALPEQVEEAFEAWQKANRQLDELKSTSVSVQQRRDLVQFHLQEFDELDTGGTAIDDIESEHRWLANAEQLAGFARDALASLDGDDGAHTHLTRATKPLASLVQLDDRLTEAQDLIDSATIQCAEATSLLTQHLTALDHDGTRLQWLDAILAKLHALAKKHQVSISDLESVEQSLRKEWEQLSNPEASHEALVRECDALKKVYQSLCAKLTKLRKKTGKKLGQDISNTLQTLGMSAGCVDIDIVESRDWNRHGQDKVQFLVSPNPGVKPAPLSKIASGGELSRISLAIALATLKAQPVATLIFDEVDAGVGGAVAERVGELLRAVGDHAQVLSVTHLPQVASKAHHHLRVVKSTQNNKTCTLLEALDTKGTLEEIARMLGGAKITKKTLAHAQEMLDTVTEPA